MSENADHVIDLGPGGGVNGGEVVVTGTPEVVAAEPRSATGAYLGPLLERASVKPVVVEVKARKAAKASKARVTESEFDLEAAK